MHIAQAFILISFIALLVAIPKDEPRNEPIAPISGFGGGAKRFI